MLKKLRNKIVLTNLIFVGVLLVAVSAAVCIFVANNLLRKEQQRLEVAVRSVTEAPGRDFIRSFGFGNGDMFGGFFRDDQTPPPVSEENEIRSGNIPQAIDGAAFAVLLDSEGNITAKQEFLASMNDESLTYALDAVEKSGKERGTIPALGLSFAKKATQQGTAVAFTSHSETVSTVTNAVIIAVCADLLILVFIAFISFRLASLSMKPVQEAWDSQKRFIADASHELKTPLTVILANNSILESSIKKSDDRQWLESNRYEAERMQKLIEEMLFLAKSDEGGYKMSLGPVNVSETAEHCCLSFEPVAFEQNVYIESSITPDVFVTADVTMLERVFGVLVDNAVKHSKPGGTVTFSLTEDAKNVYASVHNTGDPVPEADLAHIFERFYKADASRTAGDSAKSGFGLGLAIAHDIVEKLGGTIGVKSSEAEGTCFTVTLKKDK